MRNRWLSVTGAAFLMLTACSKKEKEEDAKPVVPVQLTTVANGSIQRIVTADGVLYPKTQSSVMPKISAPVRSFSVNRGDHVRRGQLLALLENKDLAAAAADTRGGMEQAQAQYATVSGATVPEEITKAQQDVKSAKEALDAAQKVLVSRQELLRQGAIARKLVDDANVAFVQAQSQYNVAQEHLKSVQNVNRQQDVKNAQGALDSAKGKYEGATAQLSYSEIRSPIDGVIADRSVFPGEIAAAGNPLLVVMDISRVIARANVPVAQATLLKVGGLATISQPDANIEVPGQNYGGKPRRRPCHHHCPGLDRGRQSRRKATLRRHRQNQRRGADHQQHRHHSTGRPPAYRRRRDRRDGRRIGHDSPRTKSGSRRQTG